MRSLALAAVVVVALAGCGGPMDDGSGGGDVGQTTDMAKAVLPTGRNIGTILNSTSHAKLEYAKGAPPPQRQPFSGVPAGALQEALNANDDMKSIIGIYDASLGARSNETSGRAIMARQREGDVSTFHFIDNLSRAIP